VHSSPHPLFVRDALRAPARSRERRGRKQGHTAAVKSLKMMGLIGGRGETACETA
jgi:hypothetical protein